jgi:hypothetical protein
MEAVVFYPTSDEELKQILDFASEHKLTSFTIIFY